MIQTINGSPTNSFCSEHSCRLDQTFCSASVILVCAQRTEPKAITGYTAGIWTRETGTRYWDQASPIHPSPRCPQDGRTSTFTSVICIRQCCAATTSPPNLQ